MVCKLLTNIHYCTFQCDSIQSFQSNLIYDCCYKIVRSIIHHEKFGDLWKVKYNAYNKYTAQEKINYNATQRCHWTVTYHD